MSKKTRLETRSHSRPCQIDSAAAAAAAVVVAEVAGEVGLDLGLDMVGTAAAAGVQVADSIDYTLAGVVDNGLGEEDAGAALDRPHMDWGQQGSMAVQQVEYRIAGVDGLPGHAYIAAGVDLLEEAEVEALRIRILRLDRVDAVGGSAWVDYGVAGGGSRKDRVLDVEMVPMDVHPVLLLLAACALAGFCFYPSRRQHL